MLEKPQETGFSLPGPGGARPADTRVGAPAERAFWGAGTEGLDRLAARLPPGWPRLSSGSEDCVVFTPGKTPVQEEVRIVSRDEILPTFRVPDEHCATQVRIDDGIVDLACLCTNTPSADQGEAPSGPRGVQSAHGRRQGLDRRRVGKAHA